MPFHKLVAPLLGLASSSTKSVNPMPIEPDNLLKQAFASHGRLALSFSGAEDVVLIDMACQLSDAVEVF